MANEKSESFFDKYIKGDKFKKNKSKKKEGKSLIDLVKGDKFKKDKSKTKKKEGKSLIDLVKGNKFKKKENVKASATSGKANKAATSKMYAAESMFKADRDKKAAIRDTAKVKTSDRTFKSTFDAATKAGKSDFTYGGRKFLTNKGKAENRDTKKTRIAPKGSIKKKSSLDADTVASYKKRIKYMKDRKAKGKNYSAKNLKELEAKLAAN